MRSSCSKTSPLFTRVNCNCAQIVFHGVLIQLGHAGAGHHHPAAGASAGDTRSSANTTNCVIERSRNIATSFGAGTWLPPSRHRGTVSGSPAASNSSSSSAALRRPSAFSCSQSAKCSRVSDGQDKAADQFARVPRNQPLAACGTRRIPPRRDRVRHHPAAFGCHRRITAARA